MAAKKKKSARKKNPAAKKKPTPRKSPKAKKGVGKRRAATRKPQSNVRVPYATIPASPLLGVRSSDQTARKKPPATDEPIEIARASVEGADTVRSLVRLGQQPLTHDPLPVHDATTARAAVVADAVAEREAKLKLAATHFASASGDDAWREAIWWAGGFRFPRAAFVGRALHDLGCVNEKKGRKEGTNLAIADRIRCQNARQLKPQIIRDLEYLNEEKKPPPRPPSPSSEGAGSKKKEPDSSDWNASLTSLLAKRLVVLQELDLLKGTYRGGAYLVGDGPRIFDGFPDWNRVDDELADRLTRPKTRPRS